MFASRFLTTHSAPVSDINAVKFATIRASKLFRRRAALRTAIAHSIPEPIVTDDAVPSFLQSNAVAGIESVIPIEETATAAESKATTESISTIAADADVVAADEAVDALDIAASKPNTKSEKRGRTSRKRRLEVAVAVPESTEATTTDIVESSVQPDVLAGADYGITNVAVISVPDPESLIAPDDVATTPTTKAEKKGRKRKK